MTAARPIEPSGITIDCQSPVCSTHAAPSSEEIALTVSHETVRTQASLYHIHSPVYRLYQVSTPLQTTRHTHVSYRIIFSQEEYGIGSQDSQENTPGPVYSRSNDVADLATYTSTPNASGDGILGGSISRAVPTTEIGESLESTSDTSAPTGITSFNFLPQQSLQNMPAQTRKEPRDSGGGE
ncbi:hypothetical protein PM082_000372 [Marasmius tenuissimus]|nr:hypothetical protein PM082_000372 [Marasmius tenuissimus]